MILEVYGYRNSLESICTSEKLLENKLQIDICDDNVAATVLLCMVGRSGIWTDGESVVKGMFQYAVTV